MNFETLTLIIIFEKLKWISPETRKDIESKVLVLSKMINALNKFSKKSY